MKRALLKIQEHNWRAGPLFWSFFSVYVFFKGLKNLRDTIDVWGGFFEVPLQKTQLKSEILHLFYWCDIWDSSEDNKNRTGWQYAYHGLRIFCLDLVVCCKQSLKVRTVEERNIKYV